MPLGAEASNGERASRLTGQAVPTSADRVTPGEATCLWPENAEAPSHLSARAIAQALHPAVTPVAVLPVRRSVSIVAGPPVAIPIVGWVPATPAIVPDLLDRWLADMRDKNRHGVCRGRRPGRHRRNCADNQNESC